MDENITDKNCNINAIEFKECELAVKDEINAYISEQGRLIVVDVNLFNVLRNKVIAIGVFIYEGNTIKGFKARKVYSGYSDNCIIECLNAGKFYFILPESNICTTSKVNVKVIAHYTDIKIPCFQKGKKRCLRYYKQ